MPETTTTAGIVCTRTRSDQSTVAGVSCKVRINTIPKWKRRPKPQRGNGATTAKKGDGIPRGDTCETSLWGWDSEVDRETKQRTHSLSGTSVPLSSLPRETPPHGVSPVVSLSSMTRNTAPHAFSGALPQSHAWLMDRHPPTVARWKQCFSQGRASTHQCVARVRRRARLVSVRPGVQSVQISTRARDRGGVAGSKTHSSECRRESGTRVRGGVCDADLPKAGSRDGLTVPPVATPVLR